MKLKSKVVLLTAATSVSTLLVLKAIKKVKTDLTVVKAKRSKGYEVTTKEVVKEVAKDIAPAAVAVVVTAVVGYSIINDFRLLTQKCCLDKSNIAIMLDERRTEATIKLRNGETVESFSRKIKDGLDQSPQHRLSAEDVTRICDLGGEIPEAFKDGYIYDASDIIAIKDDNATHVVLPVFRNEMNITPSIKQYRWIF